MHPGTPAHFALPPNSTFQEIPTQRTEFEQVQRGVSRVVVKLSEIDFQVLKWFDTLRQFIAAQHVFFNASAPSHGRINVSPKGRHSLRILNDKRVAYLVDRFESQKEIPAYIDQNGPGPCRERPSGLYRSKGKSRNNGNSGLLNRQKESR